MNVMLGLDGEIIERRQRGGKTIKIIPKIKNNISIMNQAYPIFEVFFSCVSNIYQKRKKNNVKHHAI